MFTQNMNILLWRFAVDKALVSVMVNTAAATIVAGPIWVIFPKDANVAIVAYVTVVVVVAAAVAGTS